MFAPLITGISNQFVEDLKKIADLRPLVEDYLPGRKESIKTVKNIRQGTVDSTLMHFHATGRDFGREMILPY